MEKELFSEMWRMLARFGLQIKHRAHLNIRVDDDLIFHI